MKKKIVIGALATFIGGIIISSISTIKKHENETITEVENGSIN